jgi:hypothetical protein
LSALERLAQASYPGGVVARGRALRDLALECLHEIEKELDGHFGVATLRRFVELTREGEGLTAASRALGITPEYACRSLKRTLVELLAERMQAELR